MIDLGRSCLRHRPVLVDFLDRGEVGPRTSAALGHLDRCSRCLEELEGIVLTITALRRLGDDVAGLEPLAETWPRLRVRVEAMRANRPAIASPLAGLAMSVALVVVLVVPLGFAGSRTIETGSPSADAGQVSLAGDRRAEAAYIQSARQGTLPAVLAEARTTSTFPRNYPDGYKPERKEVGPAEPSGRPPEAI